LREFLSAKLSYIDKLIKQYPDSSEQASWLGSRAAFSNALARGEQTKADPQKAR